MTFRERFWYWSIFEPGPFEVQNKLGAKERNHCNAASQSLSHWSIINWSTGQDFQHCVINGDMEYLWQRTMTVEQMERKDIQRRPICKQYQINQKWDHQSNYQWSRVSGVESGRSGCSIITRGHCWLAVVGNKTRPFRGWRSVAAAGPASHRSPQCPPEWPNCALQWRTTLSFSFFFFHARTEFSV